MDRLQGLKGRTFRRAPLDLRLFRATTVEAWIAAPLFRRRLTQHLAQRLALQFDPVSAVDDAIQDCVGEGRIADVVVPRGDRKLGRDRERRTTRAIVNNLEQILPVPRTQGGDPPIVEEQQPPLGQLSPKIGETSVLTRDLELFERFSSTTRRAIS